MIRLWQLFSSQGNFVPPGDMGNVWRHLWLSQLSGRLLLASSGWRPRMLLNILRCTAWPQTKDDPAHRVTVLR